MLRMAPEGWPFVLPGLVLTGLAGVGGALTPATSPFLHTSLLAAAAFLGLLTGFTAYFFRNPIRRRRDGDGLVLAPADGRIVEIAQVEEPGSFCATGHPDIDLPQHFQRPRPEGPCHRPCRAEKLQARGVCRRMETQGQRGQ